MKNRFIIVYTFFAAFVFIFSLSFFGFNLYKEYSTNLEKSDAIITSLSNDIRTLSYNHEENNSAYAQAIKNAIGDAGAYAFIQIKRDNETVVLYPAGKVKEETVSKLTKTFERKITVNNKNLELYFNLFLIRPDSIFYYARISFLLILIITLITVIMIIYLNITESNSETTNDENSSNSDDILSEDEAGENSGENTKDNNNSLDNIEPYPTIKEPTLSDEEETTEPEADSNKQEETEQSVSNVEVESTEDTNNSENALHSDENKMPEAESEDKTENENNHAEVTPEEVKAILSEPLTDAQIHNESARLPIDEVKPAETDNADPSGLFNPETGIGWESYLLTRLDNEINRATASEIDLALFVIKLTDFSKTSQEFKNVCNYLAIQFQFKDLLFEHNDDSIVAIKISMNVDEAINLANKLHSDICNIINGANCRIGISSRSIRMVTAERLMLEAEQAIEHSDETSPVIAFRVDSEKYRQMMEQNNK